MQHLNPTDYLDSKQIPYQVINHAPTFTAQHTAQAAKIKGRSLAKVVAVGDSRKIALVVVPANFILVQNDLRRLLRTPELRILPEHEFRDAFPFCETGAMPPFGELYGVSVFLAKELASQNTITFNAGNHAQLIQMDTSDFIELNHPKIIHLGYRTGAIAQPSMASRTQL